MDMYSQNQYPLNQWDAIDLLSVLSFAIGLENLQENRWQSAQNDVNAANDKQAQYILQEIKPMLEAQNTMLHEIIQRLERLEGKA